MCRLCWDDLTPTNCVTYSDNTNLIIRSEATQHRNKKREDIIAASKTYNPTVSLFTTTWEGKKQATKKSLTTIEERSYWQLSSWPCGSANRSEENVKKHRETCLVTRRRISGPQRSKAHPASPVMTSFHRNFRSHLSPSLLTRKNNSEKLITKASTSAQILNR